VAGRGAERDPMMTAARHDAARSHGMLKLTVYQLLLWLNTYLLTPNTDKYGE
jgi:hypothetical protein